MEMYSITGKTYEINLHNQLKHLQNCPKSYKIYMLKKRNSFWKKLLQTNSSI